jgi:hypothetical protein
VSEQRPSRFLPMVVAMVVGSLLIGGIVKAAGGAPWLTGVLVFLFVVILALAPILRPKSRRSSGKDSG